MPLIYALKPTLAPTQLLRMARRKPGFLHSNPPTGQGRPPTQARGPPGSRAARQRAEESASVQKIPYRRSGRGGSTGHGGKPPDDEGARFVSFRVGTVWQTPRHPLP